MIKIQIVDGLHPIRFVRVDHQPAAVGVHAVAQHRLAFIAEATTNHSERMKTLRQAQESYRRNLKDIDKRLDTLVESIAGREVGIKTISQKIIDLEEQKSQIEQEMMENEATLEKIKQKVASIALWEQKLTTFEKLFNEATPEERKDLLRLHINYLIYTPDGILLALFRSSNEADRSEVQGDGSSGSGGRI